MNKSVSQLNSCRRDYTYGELNDGMVNENPFIQFDVWFQEAEKTVDLPDAMVLATSIEDQPDARVVALRGFSKDGFIFYTNYKSKKGKDLKGNPKATILFYWKPMDRQVRIHGVISKIKPSISDDYFCTRSDESNFAQICSHQSSVISSRKKLELQFETTKKMKDLSRPDWWGGYILKPDYFEFWQGRDNRLHDRLSYKKIDNNWTIQRLQP